MSLLVLPVYSFDMLCWPVRTLRTGLKEEDLIDRLDKGLLSDDFRRVLSEYACENVFGEYGERERLGDKLPEKEIERIAMILADGAVEYAKSAFIQDSDLIVLSQDDCPRCEQMKRSHPGATVVRTEELVDGTSRHPQRNALLSILELSDGELPIRVWAPEPEVIP